MQVQGALSTANSNSPADNGASKKKGKAGAAFVLGRGTALFRGLVESAAAGLEADADADIVARSARSPSSGTSCFRRNCCKSKIFKHSTHRWP